jgi:hypothetical protein
VRAQRRSGWSDDRIIVIDSDQGESGRFGGMA